jgi:hypothetical protein
VPYIGEIYASHTYQCMDNRHLACEPSSFTSPLTSKTMFAGIRCCVNVSTSTLQLFGELCRTHTREEGHQRLDQDVDVQEMSFFSVT